MIAEISWLSAAGHRVVRYVRLTVAEVVRNRKLTGKPPLIYTMHFEGFKRRVRRDSYGQWYFEYQGRRVSVRLITEVPPGVKVEPGTKDGEGG